VEWETAKKWGVYPEGAAVNKGEPLFPRIDVKKSWRIGKLTLAAAENKEKQSPKQETEKKDAERMNISP